MKYIITESQYNLIHEQLEREIVKLPIRPVWTWEQVQDYLHEIGNPYYIVRNNLSLTYVELPSTGKLVEVS